MSLPQLVCLACYYLVAMHLPDNMLFIKWGGVRVRRMLCSYIFKKCGKGVMIHKGANFGSGLDIEIGDHSDIGVNAVIPSNTIIGRCVDRTECHDDARSFDTKGKHNWGLLCFN